jgi:hypothetical protein
MTGPSQAKPGHDTGGALVSGQRATASARVPEKRATPLFPGERGGGIGFEQFSIVAGLLSVAAGFVMGKAGHRRTGVIGRARAFAR